MSHREAPFYLQGRWTISLITNLFKETRKILMRMILFSCFFGNPRENFKYFSYIDYKVFLFRYGSVSIL
jgi:hypothetical protein